MTKFCRWKKDKLLMQYVQMRGHDEGFSPSYILGCVNNIRDFDEVV